MSGPALTEVQRALLNFLTEFQALRGYAPTHREIRERFGWSSYGTVAAHLRRLTEKGLVAVGAGQKRGAVAVEDSRDALLRRCRRALEALHRAWWHAGEDPEADDRACDLASDVLVELAGAGITSEEVAGG